MASPMGTLNILLFLFTHHHLPAVVTLLNINRRSFYIVSVLSYSYGNIRNMRKTYNIRKCPRMRHGKSRTSWRIYIACDADLCNNHRRINGRRIDHCSVRMGRLGMLQLKV